MGTISNRTCRPIRDCLTFGACWLVVVVSLPLLAIVLFALRPLVVFAVLAAVLAVVSPWVLAPRIRGRWQSDIAPEQAYKGLRLARDVALHPGHSWAWIGEGEVVVGADDLAQAELGPIDGVELPALGQRVHRDDPLFRLHHGGRMLELPAPVSGTVVGSNEELRAHPDLVNRRPFSLGWVARIRAGDEIDDDRRRLLAGRRAWRWFRSEVDRVLQAVLLRRAGQAAGPVSGEGGVAPEELHRLIDDSAWSRLCARRGTPAGTVR